MEKLTAEQLFNKLNCLQSARHDLFREFIITRCDDPPDTFETWLRRRPGLADASDDDVQSIKNLVFPSVR